MQLDIVTPEKTVYSETIESVVLPTTQGEVGILPGHIPLTTSLEPGELRIEKAGQGKPEILAVDRGFAQVIGDRISVLTEAAVDVGAIDLSEVDAALSRAQAALEEARKEKRDPKEIEDLEGMARFAIAQQMVKRRRM